MLPAREALAQVALEVSDRPLVASNVDLTEARAGGLATDLAARFLDELARAASLTLHVRLIDGDDSQHVLEAIFKALGVALAAACAVPEATTDDKETRWQRSRSFVPSARPHRSRARPTTRRFASATSSSSPASSGCAPGGSAMVGDTIAEQTEQVLRTSARSSRRRARASTGW